MSLNQEIEKAEFEAVKKGHINKDLEEEILTELEGQRNFKSGFLYWLIALISFSWSLYQIYVSYFPINSTLVRSTHLSFAMILAFLIYPIAKKPYFIKKLPWYDYILAIFGGIGAGYICL